MQLRLLSYLLLASSCLSFTANLGPAKKLLAGTWILVSYGPPPTDELNDKLVLTKTSFAHYTPYDTKKGHYILSNKPPQQKAETTVNKYPRYINFLDEDNVTTSYWELVRLDTDTLAIREVDETKIARFKRIK